MDPKKPSSSWFRLSNERRELDVAPFLIGVMDIFRTRAAQCGGDPDQMGTVWKAELAAEVRRIVTSIWDSGAAQAAGLRSALDVANTIRERMAERLRELGEKVPTDRMESSPAPPPVPAHAVVSPRRPSSSIEIKQWGLVEVWLAENDARGIVIRAPATGLQVTAIDPVKGERNEAIAGDEDPSRAALRAIARMFD